jgi:hypothetical protein
MKVFGACRTFLRMKWSAHVLNTCSAEHFSCTAHHQRFTVRHKSTLRIAKARRVECELHFLRDKLRGFECLLRSIY